MKTSTLDCLVFTAALALGGCSTAHKESATTSTSTTTETRTYSPAAPAPTASGAPPPSDGGTLGGSPSYEMAR